jgi:hypothetical protein
MEQGFCWEANSYSANPFTEPECLLPPSQKPTISPGTESDYTNPTPPPAPPYLFET